MLSSELQNVPFAKEIQFPQRPRKREDLCCKYVTDLSNKVGLVCFAGLVFGVCVVGVSFFNYFLFYFRGWVESFYYCEP